MDNLVAISILLFVDIGIIIGIVLVARKISEFEGKSDE